MPWILDRLFAHNEQPAPRFAFQGTVNWARALAIAVDAQPFTEVALRTRYQGVQRRQVNEEADTLAYECLLMAISQAASGHHFSGAQGNVYDICRPAIVAWYYCIYYASKAMLASRSGADPQTHASAARQYQVELILPGLIAHPFDLSVVSIVPNDVDAQIAALRQGANSDLNTTPTNLNEARGALCSYLRGTCEYRQEGIEDRVRSSSQFKALSVTNFRTKAARALRDQSLLPEAVNFMTQAFRYRGKANYRDAIYLSYGADNSAALRQLISDLATTASAYLRMAATYVSKRTEVGTWQDFVADCVVSGRMTHSIDLCAI